MQCDTLGKDMVAWLIDLILSSQVLCQAFHVYLDGTDVGAAGMTGPVPPDVEIVRFRSAICSDTQNRALQGWDYLPTDIVHTSLKKISFESCWQLRGIASSWASSIRAFMLSGTVSTRPVLDSCSSLLSSAPSDIQTHASSYKWTSRWPLQPAWIC